jgi:hypothetical protein
MSTAIASFDEAFPMSDSSSRLSLTALEKPVNHTMRLIKFAVFAVSVAAAIPTAQNLYYSWQHDVPFNEVSHRLDQYDLWMKNFDCKIDYRALSTSAGTRVDVGACPKTGDIAIKVSQDGKATYEWIAYNALQKPASQSASLLNLFVSTAHAASDAPSAAPRSTAADADGSFRIAQAGMQVLCEARVNNQIVRIVRDGGRCFREALSPFKGTVDSRTEVPCNAQCQ